MVLSKADVEKYINRFETSVQDPKKRKIKKLEIARLYKEAKQPEKAIECIEEYLEITQKDHRAFNLLGAVYEELAKWEEALKCYKKSVELECTQKDVFLKIIEVYAKVNLQQPHIAMVWADKAAKVFPNHPAVFDLKWHVLNSADEKDYEEMEDILAQRLVSNPRDVSLHIKLVSLYIAKDELKEAFVHCLSLVESGAFQNNSAWLDSCLQVFETFYNRNSDSDDGIESFMKFASVQCLHVNECLKSGTTTAAKILIQKLDNAVYDSLLLNKRTLSENLKEEVKVFQNELRGQLYFSIARLIMKLAQEHEIGWDVASKFASGLLCMSSSVREPNTKAMWFIKKSAQDSKSMIWHTMACHRLSQTDHSILTLMKRNGEKWILSANLNTCSELGKQEVLEIIHSKNGPPSSSYFTKDKNFLQPGFEMPNTENLLRYDEIAISTNPEDLNYLVWIGLNWKYLEGCMKPEVVRLIWRLFRDIPMDVDNMKNCSPFSLSSKDLEVFIEAIVFSAFNKHIENNEAIKEDCEPALLPVQISPDLVTASQQEFWNAVCKLQTGKTWQSSTSKLKSVVQKGLETLRVVGNHGIDARILKYVSDTFLSKVEGILVESSTDWKSHSHIESLQKRGYYYAHEALRILEISLSENNVPQPKKPLIEPLVRPLKENERNDLISEIRLEMADAAFRDNLHDDALKFLAELYTADSAYREAQVYRDLATKEDLSNVEGLRNHLSHLRKARERLQTCISRLDEPQAGLRSEVQSEIDEIHKAIADQSGISPAPSKILDFRYSTLEETTDNEESPSLEDPEQQAEDGANDSKLALENSILHEQLAVRNHQFSVLAQRIYKLEREIVDLRKNQSGSESMLRSGSNTMSLSGHTDETSSSVPSAAKDDATSGSGNNTPRLEPEMSWDPFSPSPNFPVFDKGFFSGLADTVDKIEEETETEVGDAGKDTPRGLTPIKENSPEKSKTPVKLEVSGSSQNDVEDGDGDDIYVKPVVQLTKKVNLITGEEDEETIFMERAKLYCLTDGQWKERGAGDFKILFNPKTGKNRVLMRRDHVLRVCANHVITSSIKLQKKEGNATTFIWFTVADASEQSPKPETFAVRFKTEEIANKFESVFNSCQSKKEEPVTISSTSKELSSSRNQSSSKGNDVSPSGNYVSPSGNGISHQQPILSKVVKSPLTAGNEAKEDNKAKETKGLAFTPTRLDFSKAQDDKPGEDKKKFDFSALKFDFGKKSENDDSKEGKQQQGFKLTPSRFGSAEKAEKEPTSTDKKFQFPNIKFDFGSSSAQPKERGKADVFGNLSTSSDKKYENPFLVEREKTTNENTSSPFSFSNPKNQQQSSFDASGTKTPLFLSLAAQSTPLEPSPILPRPPNTENLTPNARQTPDLRQNIFGSVDFSSHQPSAGTGSDVYQSNELNDQAACFQTSWEATQDKYYCEGAYADQDQYYVNDENYYGNEEYYNGSGYYDEDDYENEDEDVYYENEGGIEYYDQETVKQVAKGDSDANSDRQSPQDDPESCEEPVPRVVQMVDEDVFVTFVKKASFAERARASRFQLPPMFFSPSSRPPCPGCIGCDGEKSTERDSSHSMAKSPLVESKANSKSAEIKTEPVKKEENEKNGTQSSFSGVLGSASSSFQTFSDLLKGNQQKQSPFKSKSNTTASFSGAGAVLFSSAAKEDTDADAYDPQYKAIVELEKKDDLKTGEEGYIHLFKHRAKLYRFDSELKQWKERGVGDMKLSHNPLNHYCRVLMRRDVIHKLCANHPIMPDIELKPHDLSTTSLVWVSGADYAEEQPTVEKFAVKFKNIEICDEFKRVFEQCKKIMVKYVDNLNKKQSENTDVVSESAKEETKDAVQSGASCEVEGNGKEASQAGMNNSTSRQRENAVANLEATQPAQSPTLGSPKPAQPPIFGSAKPAQPPIFGSSKPGQSPLFGSSTPISFPTSTINSSSFSFGNHVVKKSEEKTVDSSSSVDKKDSKVTSPSVNEEDSRIEKKDEQKDWKSKFSRKAGSWECPTCMIINDGGIPQCPACETRKPGEVEKSKPVVQSSNQTKQSVWSQFNAPTGSWECSMCLIRNKPDVNVCPACETIKEGTDKTTGQSNQQEKTGLNFGTNSSDQEKNAKFSFGTVKAPMFGSASPNFGTTAPKFGSASPMFGTAAPISFPTSNMSSSPFSFGKPVQDSKPEAQTFGLIKPFSDKKETMEKENESTASTDWDCPTCSVSNHDKVINCSSCKTRNPTSDVKVSPVVIKTSPLAGQISAAVASTNPESANVAFNSKPSTASPFNVSTKPQTNLVSPFSTPTSNKSVSASSFSGFKFGNNQDSLFKPDTKNTSPQTTQTFVPSGSFVFGRQADETKDKGLNLFSTPNWSSGAEKDATNEPQTPDSPSKGDDHSLPFAPIVELKKVERQPTGEENEEAIFSEKTKLYRYDSDAKQWKERGVGELKILQKTGLAKFRIIMRRDQVHKLCANHNLVSGMSVKLMENSEKAFIWNTAADFSEEEVKAETFAARFRSVLIAKEFEKVFSDSVKKIDTDDADVVEIPKGNYSSDEKVETDAKVKEVEKAFDLKVTYQFVPDEKEKDKAEKLLLSKEFYNVPASKQEENKEEKEVSSSNVVVDSPDKFAREEECEAVFKPIVELKKVEMKSGDESEEVLFCEKAKVYRLDSSIPQWKERGAGELKMLRNLTTGQTRLIMRRDLVKKVCLNHLLQSGMKLEDSSMSKRTVVWFTLADFSDEEAKPEKFAARFKTDDAFNEFKSRFHNVVSNIEQTKEEATIEPDVCERSVENDDGKSTKTEKSTKNEENRSSETPGKETAEKQSIFTADSTNAKSNEKFSFKFSSANEAKPKEPQKKLFDFTSTLQPQGKFEFPSKFDNLFSLGSSGDAKQQQGNAAEEAAVDSQPTSVQDGPSSTANSWSFSWGKPTSTFSFLKDASKETDGKASQDQASSTVGTDGTVLKADTKSPFAFVLASNKTDKDKADIAASKIDPPFNFTSILDKTEPIAKDGLFQIGNKSDEAPKQSAASHNTSEEYHAEEECEAKFEAIVTLEKKEQSTGEELEEAIFSEKAKAYRFDSDGPQWKERGVGVIKILRNIKNDQYRVLMRRDQVKKICINHRIMPEMVIEPNENSKNCWVWFCHADFSELEPKAEKFAVRFRNEDAYTSFKDCFDRAKSAMKEVLFEKEAGDDDVTKQQETDNISTVSKSTTGNAHSDHHDNDGSNKVGTSAEITESAKKESLLKQEDADHNTYDDCLIVYVKEPSDEELERAICLLLPSAFFTADNSFQIRRKPASANSFPGNGQEASDSTSKMSSFGFQSTGLKSFSDLKSNTDSSPLFKTSQNKEFAKKGQILFQPKPEDDSVDNYEAEVNFKPIVTLEKKEIMTGEEQEESLFDEKCKLYRYDGVGNEWKERGVGKLKILHHKTRGSYRIVMRRDQIFKICANHVINADMKPLPRPGIETTWLWKTNADISEGEVREEMFTARFKSAEIGKMFAKTFESCCQALKAGESRGDGSEIEAENKSATRQKEDSSPVNETENEEAAVANDSHEVKDDAVTSTLNPELTSAEKKTEVAAKERIVHANKQDAECLPPTTTAATNVGSSGTFGSGFVTMSFASLANRQPTAFASPEKGSFTGAGKVLFSGAAEGSSPEHDPHYEPVVQLAKVEMKSGEENEKVLFESRIKLYKFDGENKEWKERGIGNLKLLQHNESGKGRLVMRREQIHKVCANHRLTEGMRLDRMTSSNRTLIWKSMADMSEGAAEEALFAARFKSDDIMQDFQKLFENLCESSQNATSQETTVKSPGKSVAATEETKKPDAATEETSISQVTVEESEKSGRTQDSSSGPVGSCSPSISANLQDFINNLS